MKKCPFCAEEIQDEAIKCRHCGSAIVSPVIEAWAQRWSALSDSQRREGWEKFSDDERRQLTAALGEPNATTAAAAPVVVAAVPAQATTLTTGAPHSESVSPFGCATVIGAGTGVCLLAIVAGAADTPSGMGTLFGLFAAVAVVGGLMIKAGSRRAGITTTVVAGSLALIAGLLFLGQYSDNKKRIAERAAAEATREQAEDQRLADLRSQRDANFHAATEAVTKGDGAEAQRLLALVVEVAPDYPGAAELKLQAEELAARQHKANLVEEAGRKGTTGARRQAIYSELMRLEPDNRRFRQGFERAEKDAQREAREEAKAQAKANAVLEVRRWTWGEEYDYAIAQGTVKNLTSQSLKNVQAVVTFYDSSGEFITSDSALIDYNPILPGQTSPWKVMARWNPAMKRARVEFKSMFGPTLPSYED